MNTETAVIPDPKSLEEKEKRAFWVAQLKSFEESGLSSEAYCHKHSLVHHQFRYWHKKFSEPSKKSTKTNTLVPVNLTSTPQHCSQLLCMLKFTNGSELSIYDISALSIILETIR